MEYSNKEHYKLESSLELIHSGNKTSCRMLSSLAMEKQPDQKKNQTRTLQEADARPVLSSKRRCDGFKRASETRAFNAAHTGIVFFSPCGKAYSFDDLHAEGGMNMLCAPWISNTDAIQDFGIRDDPVLDALDRTCTGILGQLEIAKKQSELKQKLPGKEGHPLYGKPIDHLNLEELQTLKADLLDLKEKVNQQNELLAKQSSGINN